MALNYKIENLKVIYMRMDFILNILNKLDLYHIKLFNDHFHLKINYDKSVGPIFHKTSHLINKIMNASSDDKFNQYKKDLLWIGQGKPSLIFLKL